MKDICETIIIKGVRFSQGKIDFPTKFKCIISDDFAGKLLSISDGVTRFTIPFETIEKYLRGGKLK